MALITCNFFSHALEIHTAVHVILPQPGPTLKARKRYPVLWLLHGLSDDHTIWQRRTAIERYVENLPLAVVMPAVNRSFYHDMVAGAAYWSYISDELPRLLQQWFPLSQKRDETFVAGLSMGGYGALKLALRQPERFAAVASLSGAVAHGHLPPNPSPMDAEFRRMLGETMAAPGSDLDLFALAERITRAGAPLPKTWLYCGSEDFLYQENLAFHAHLQALAWPHTWIDEPGGDHQWRYWDEQIEQVVAWLGLA